jgi:hypothetical protein
LSSKSPLLFYSLSLFFVFTFPVVC